MTKRSKRVLRHKIAALQELFLNVGKTITLSIVHGGPGASFFAEPVVDYIFGSLGAVTAHVIDNPNRVIQQ